MKKIIIIFAILIIGISSQLSAQKKALPIYTAATNNKAYIIIVNAPLDMEGFNVYRNTSGESKYLRLTKKPVGPVVDPSAVRNILADDYDWIVRALRAEDDFEITRRLQSDRGVSAVLSLASLNAAKTAGRLFIDENVNQGETYTYKVEFIDYEGKVLSKVKRDIQVNDRQPSIPAAVTGEAGDSKVEIKWDYPVYKGNPDDIVVGFNIYRKDGMGDFEKINKVLIMRQEEMKERTDINVQNNSFYSYYVTSVDCIGRESSPSQQVNAKPVDLTPPSFPQGLDLHEEEGTVLLSWNMNLELDLSHYDVYRSLKVNSGYEKINKVPVPADKSSYADKDVYFGPTYYYKLKAMDLPGNESEFSNTISGRPIDIEPPSQPLNVKAIVKNQYVRLSWEAPLEIDLQGYYIYRRRSDLEYLRIVNLPLGKDILNFYDTGYNLRGLWQGQTYFYAISSVDNFFNESKKKIIEVIIPDNEPPGTPLSSYAHSTREGLVEITWQPSMSLDVVNYRIFRTKNNGESKSIKETADSIYKAIDSSAALGFTYDYQVAAVDRFGNESIKTEKTQVIPRDLTIPPAPENVSAVVNAKGVLITWEPVRVNDLLGYNIYRSDIPNGIPEKLNSGPLTNPKFIDSEGETGKYYRVSSLDTSRHENNRGKPVEAISEKDSSIK